MRRRQLYRTSLSEAMTKIGHQIFSRKIGWHPSVAANPSDRRHCSIGQNSFVAGELDDAPPDPLVGWEGDPTFHPSWHWPTLALAMHPPEFQPDIRLCKPHYVSENGASRVLCSNIQQQLYRVHTELSFCLYRYSSRPLNLHGVAIKQKPPISHTTVNRLS